MNFEKIVNSKAYGVFDWIYRLIILNMLIIISSIFIVTILPSLVAGYLTIKGFAEDRDQNIFKAYYNNFILKIKPTLIINVIVLILLFVFSMALLQYADAFAEGTNLFFIIGFAFIIFSIFVLLLTLLHMVPVIAYFNFKVIDNIKFSFYMAVKYIGTTFLIFLISFFFIMLLWLNFTIPVWVMMGFSGNMLFVYRVTRPIYGYLLSNRGYVVDDDIKDESEEE